MTRIDAAGPPPGPLADLGTVLEAFTESWERGDRPRAEVYLDWISAEDSAELIYHEYCLAEASELDPDPDEFLRRFPEHAEALSRLFQLHSAFSPEDLAGLAGPSALPRVGDDIGPYRLVRELGEGAFARVFLAEQIDLDDRLVVLKVSTRATAEPRLLARASHTHIVPVIRHGSTEDGDLHLVCMPYLGGATLGDLLAARLKDGRRPRTGADLLADLDRISGPGHFERGGGRPIRDFLARSSYAQAVAWIVARLAEALEHAHRRGVSHGDMKPSNILLTADAVPMLFDFNLAVDRRDDDAGPGSDAGGTLAYMAPERLKALAGAGDAGPMRSADRHRADLYGLGLVLLEALTGRPPELPRDRHQGQKAMASALAAARTVARRPPRGRKGRTIPPALGAILARCLAPDPADRYALGRELAEDLDLWCADRPLAFAEEPRVAGLATWARRHRLPLIAGVATLATALGAGGFAWMAIRGSKADQAIDKRSFLDRADANAFLFHDLGDWASDEHGDAAENARIQLGRYDVLGPGDWTQRDDVRYLPEPDRGDHEAWIVEHVWRYADAVVRDRPDARKDWETAAALLDRTIARFPLGPLRATREVLAAKVGPPRPAAPGRIEGPAPAWMESYLSGVAAERDHARVALGHYRDALRARPDTFWADYRAAVVASRINDYPDATRHIKRCLARRPDNPALHTQLACMLLKVTEPRLRRTFAWQVDPATAEGDPLAECDRALEIDPEFHEALATRAMILRSSGRWEEVEGDFHRHGLLTRSRGESRTLMARFRSHSQLGSSYHPPTHRGEKALLSRALEAAPGDGDVRAMMAASLLADGRADDAIAACDRILEKDPRHLRGRYIRALARHQLKHPGAIGEFARLIADPRFEEVLREDLEAIRSFHYVATDHLKGGRFGPALEVARTGLAHLDRLGLRSGAGSLLGESHYLIARIHASAPDASDRLPAIADHLGRAFEEHASFRDGWFATDVRFNAIRGRLQVPLVE
ncbi:protein kinase domain-containing protein [Tundrisphaera sp. TA3]|uniref:protein kinase domain-containing protein n=1 Tax=Tundrisphaera sp. TA3 TaxID=3435775 RepID=UPI003EBE0464